MFPFTVVKSNLAGQCYKHVWSTERFEKLCISSYFIKMFEILQCITTINSTLSYHNNNTET